MTGRVEDAVRRAVSPGVPATPTGRGAFTVKRYTTDGLVLLLGKKEQSGAHEQLVTVDGTYAELFSLQASASQ